MKPISDGVTSWLEAPSVDAHALWGARSDAELLTFYATLRSSEPVSWDKATESWLVAQYRLVWSVLRDHRTFGQAFRPEIPADRYAGWNAFKRSNMIDLDPPDHRRLRGTVARSFTPRRSEQMRPWISELARELASAALDRSGEVDVVADVAEPLAVAVIAQLLGVPASDRQLLRRWGNAIVRMYEPVRDTTIEDAAFVALQEFTEYIGAHIDSRRTAPTDDLLSALVGRGDDDAGLSVQEIVSTSILLLNGGHETSVNALGNAVVSLLENPQAQRRLRADQELTSSAADELLRYRSPLRIFQRRTLEETELDEVRLPAGSRVTLLLESANRDPEGFEHPDTLILDRAPNRHVAFGTGIHVCLGAPLARIELEESLRTLLELLPEWRLDRPPTRRPSFQFNGFTSVALAS